MTKRPNAGWLFYKKSFFKIRKKGPRNLTVPNNLKDVATELLDTAFVEHRDGITPSHRFTLKVLYPGLVVGTGYPHSLKNAKDNFDFGFFFDHLTGMPLIPGSSVKGVLRSYFRLLDNKDKRDAAVAMFAAFNAKLDNLKTLKTLEAEIFEGKNTANPYQRDIFYDAVLAGTSDEYKKKVFADDAITPHADPLADPVPNRMLKAAPGTCFAFRFDLKNGSVLKADEKCELFKNLLLLGGAGAKTTVGYGQFDEAGECDEPHPGDG
jgi:CRISPR-associated protein Cmr6